MITCTKGHKTTLIYNATEKKCKGFYCGECKEFIKAVGRERKLKPEAMLCIKSPLLSLC